MSWSLPSEDFESPIVLTSHMHTLSEVSCHHRIRPLADGIVLRRTFHYIQIST